MGCCGGSEQWMCDRTCREPGGTRVRTINLSENWGLAIDMDVWMRDADLCAVVDGVMNFYCYTVCLFFIVVANYVS